MSRTSLCVIALLSLFGVSCAESTVTRLIVLMDTDYPVPTEVDRIRARVAKLVDTDEGQEEMQTWERVFEVSSADPTPPGTYGLPATFAILAADADVDRDIVVELHALRRGTEQAVSVRRVKTGFVSGQTRLVRLLIHRACENVSCDAGESCGCADASSCATPSCVDEWVSPEILEPIDDPDLLPPSSDFPVGGGNGAGGAGGTGGVGGSGGSDCESPLVLCGDRCVNTSTDPRFCGSCAVACPSGYVCESARCVDPGDCRTNDIGCTGFTYCDPDSGSCLRGCSVDTQCGGDHEVCNVATHECVCDAGFERCVFDCVDTSSDPRFCGGCTTSCPPGEVCELGSCLDPGDCRTNELGCTGFTYCDETTGNCLRGCDDDLQCAGANQVCDVDLHECVCSSGFHRCAGTCVSDLDVNSCGTRCTPCPSPPGATAICQSGVCDFVCDVSLTRCADECVDTESDPRFCGDCAIACPTGNDCVGGECIDPGDCRTNGLGCSGFTYCDQLTGDCLEGCAFDDQCTGMNEVCNTTTHACECAPGFHSCGDVCVSDLDVASCGTACTPCPEPQNATAVCELGQCDFVCDATFERCGGACCPTSCPPGQVLFERTCAPLHVRVADDQGNVGEYASLALDTTGVPHLSYYGQSGKNLLYSRWQTGGLWVREAAAATGDVGRHSSMALDAFDVPHIAAYDADNKDLVLARRQSAAAWVVETVDALGDVGQHASLAFDSGGTAHVAYYDEGNKDLLLATGQPGGAWAVRTVASQGDVGRHASLALGPGDTLHVAYYDEGNEDLLVAIEQPGGVWAYEVVAAQGDVGTFASLAFDRDGVAHLAYYDETTKDLRFAARQAIGLWSTETVDSQGDVGSYSSLAFDGAGTAHIAYFDESNKQLRHAVRKVGQSWRLQTVDDAGDVGRFASIEVDDEGHAHVGYYDATNTNLKYVLIAAPQ